ncbi:MAG: TFIIB-type zinc ribbon-containing protein [Anaerolineaceae bacterium]|nr:TFIIB-type zinc ribbon-containing protein [Anaerolineaceae bacterium]
MPMLSAANRRTQSNPSFVLTTLGGSMQLEQLAPAVERVSAALSQSGFPTEAHEVAQSIHLALQTAGLSQKQAGQPVLSQQQPERRTLPPSCPSCGGPLLPKEVDWHDHTTALCPFCGSVIP